MDIKTAAQLTNVSADTIRYYERVGLVPAIDRNESGRREIDERIIRRINFTKEMRRAGMGIDALQRYIRLFDAKEDNYDAQLNLLQDQLELLTEKRDDLNAAIDHLEFKIANYAQHMVASEEELKQLEKQHADRVAHHEWHDPMSEEY